MFAYWNMYCKYEYGIWYDNEIPKFSERLAGANSVDPNQTAPMCSKFRMITSIFGVSKNLAL